MIRNSLEYFMFFFISLLALLSTKTYSQNLDVRQLDSLAAELPKMKDDTTKGMVYQTLGRGYSAIDLNKAAFYGRALEQMSKRIKWDDGKGIAYNILGFVHLRNNLPDSAYYFYKNANDIYKKTGNQKGYAATHANLGNVAMHKANFPEALRHYMDGLKAFESVNERANITTLNMNIGLVFGNMKMYAQSKQYLKNALKLNKEDNNEVGECMALVNLGSIYLIEDKSLDSAKNYLNQAVAIGQKADLEGNVIDAKMNLAAIYLKEKNYDAVNAILNSDLLKTESVQPDNRLSMAQIKAEMLFQQKQSLTDANLRQALSILLPADSIARAIEKNESVVVFAKLLSTTYEKLGEFDKALYHFKRFQVMEDSIDNSDNRQALKNLEHQRELELKDTQLKLNTLELQNQKRLQWIAIGIIVAVIAIGTIFWYQNKQRKIANKKLSITNKELDASNKVKARFFSILSHDLRAPISSLSNYLYLLKEGDEAMENDMKAMQQNKIETATNNLLSTMEDILLWSKSQMERFEPIKKNIPVANLYSDVQKLLPTDSNIKFVFNNPEQIELYTDDNYIKTIMRNLTANAIKALKHVPDAKIEWNVYTQHGKRYLSITDNGPGLSEDQMERLFNDDAVISTKSGLGLHLVRDLAKMLQHTMEVNSIKGQGTTFTIEINNKS